ncbi:hypothetical protein BD626DRAFT_205100 [Schizophyllum amplum]|uniref:Shieldin complex subunit 2 first OB fold domain-containing protein n=1 Tax=Schizophyllum amplum TaxID=97359 RepID=A0A550BZG7_9AGAR|nr:hypothetical protein BD626DRAFT_205100 [Auriculariopsis ampla]
MTPRYRVFLGAPPARDHEPRRWVTFSSSLGPASSTNKLGEESTDSSAPQTNALTALTNGSPSAEGSAALSSNPSVSFSNRSLSSSACYPSYVETSRASNNSPVLDDSRVPYQEPSSHPTFSDTGVSFEAHSPSVVRTDLPSAESDADRQTSLNRSSATGLLSANSMGRAPSSMGLAPSATPIYLPATLEAASRRISLIYKNTIFHEDDDESESGGASQGHQSGAQGERSAALSAQGSGENSTYISWPPSYAQSGGLSRCASRSHVPASVGQTMRTETLTMQTETQETQSSAAYSDSSCIANFPAFRFSLHALASLSELQAAARPVAGPVNFFGGGAQEHKAAVPQRKVTLLLAVLEIDGPDTIRVKRGADAGREVSVLRMVLGDEAGRVCKLAAWREVADTWAAAKVRRGDVVLLENVNAASEPGTSPSLSASPFLHSNLEICYRSMPTDRADYRLRPDLRLGGIDPAVRRVEAVVRWFERMAGLPVGGR